MSPVTDGQRALIMTHYRVTRDHGLFKHRNISAVALTSTTALLYQHGYYLQQSCSVYNFGNSSFQAFDNSCAYILTVVIYYTLAIAVVNYFKINNSFIFVLVPVHAAVLWNLIFSFSFFFYCLLSPASKFSCSTSLSSLRVCTHNCKRSVY